MKSAMQVLLLIIIIIIIIIISDFFPCKTVLCYAVLYWV
jgi:hypothetical protein